MLNEHVIVAMGRSAIARAHKGALKDSHPVDYASKLLVGVLNKIPQLNINNIDEIVYGCAKNEGVQSYNIANLIKFRAGIPDCVPAHTVNRFCASSLQSIATACNMIAVGQANVVIAGGVETMSQLAMGTEPDVRNHWLSKNLPNAYISMGLTAENVADRYAIDRLDMDLYAIESHRKADRAQGAGKFKKEIIPISLGHSENIFAEDEGIRQNASLDKISSLQPVFKEGGKVTAANSSQMSDGTSALVIMAREKANDLGLKPIAKLRSYAVIGVPPEIMGIGPIGAVKRVLSQSGLQLRDIDLIELNEAFAAQAIAVIRELNLNENIVNVNGGAIALGHPLGATGGILMIKAISELKCRQQQLGLVTMCIGGGMGAAAIIENLD